MEFNEQEARFPGRTPMRQQDSTWEEDVREHFESILEAVDRKHPGVQAFWEQVAEEQPTLADGFVELYALSGADLPRALQVHATHKLALTSFMEPLHALQRIRGAALPGQGKFIRAVQDAFAPRPQT